MKTLYRLILSVLLLTCVFDAGAKKEKKDKIDKENEMVVEVTMPDGSVEKGIISTHWTSALKKGFNKTFVMLTNDGRKLNLNGEEVDSVYFPLRGEGQLKTYRMMSIPQPKIGNMKNISRWMSGMGPKSEHAQIVIPMVWTHVLIGNGRTVNSYPELQPMICLHIEGDSISYPFYCKNNGNFNLAIIKKFLKDKNPGLVEYLEAYFKSNKKAKKEIGKHPEIMLDVYEEYLKTIQ
ncbi:MAG: hypothetical protein NC349_02060 [Paenibacillus sp.]|nr:hypothetical protein [Paenibacillus sp.]